MRSIDRMMHDALTIKDSLRDTIFLAMTDIMEYTTEIHIKTKYGVEIIKETHESEQDAIRYLEDIMKRYRVDPDMVQIIDNF